MTNLKFEIVETKLHKEGFIVLKCRNLAIPDLDPEKIRKDQTVDPFDIESMTQQAIKVMRKNMIQVQRQSNPKIARIPVTRETYKKLGSPVVGETLTFSSLKVER